MSTRQRIVTFLWFNDNAEEAVNHYLSIFKNSKIVAVSRCGEAGPGPKGSVLTIDFELDGQRFIALNGGPMYTFNEAISLFIECETQDEIDSYWSKLTAGGTTQACGWLKDKFGVSWQVCPKALLGMLTDTNAPKAARAMQAMMQMVKLDIAKLKTAYEGR